VTSSTFNRNVSKARF